MCTIGAHHMSTPPEEDLDAPTAVTWLLGCEFAHHSDHWRIALDQPRLVTQC